MVVLLCLLMAGSLPALAQKKILHGYVLDSATRLPIANVTVTNENMRKTVTTAKNGYFSLLVNYNDLLFFNASSYRFDTLHCNRILPDTVYIDLSQLAMLQGVTVTTTTHGYSQYQKDSIRRRDSFYNDIGGPRQKAIVPGTSNSGAGMGISLDRFLKKKERAKKNAIDNFEEYEKYAYINARFNSVVVKQYTGLEGDSLQQFVDMYRPDYKYLRAHPTEEDILYYINDKLKQYMHKK